MRASGTIAALVALASAAVAQEAPFPGSAAAEAALADGLSSVAEFIATNEFAQAASPAEKDRLFAVLAEARESALPREEFENWLQERQDAAGLPSHRYFTARAAILGGRYGDALKILEKLGRELPEDSYLKVPVQLNRAVALDRCGRRKDAEALLGAESAKRGTPALSKMLLEIAGGDLAAASNTLALIRSDKESDPGVKTHGEVMLARACGDETALTNALASLEGKSKPMGKTRARVTLRMAARAADTNTVRSVAGRLAADGTDNEDDAAAIRDAVSLLSDAGASGAVVELAGLYLSSFPTTADEAFVNSLLGRAHEALGNFTAAAAAYMRAAGSDGSGEKTRLALKAAEMQLKAGMPNQALATLASPAFAEPAGELAAPAAFLSAECEAELNPTNAAAAYGSVRDRFPGTEQAEIARQRIDRLETAKLVEASGSEAGSEPGRIELAPEPKNGTETDAHPSPDAGNKPGTLAGIIGDDSKATPDEQRELAENYLNNAIRKQREGLYAEACISLEHVLNNGGDDDLRQRAAAMYPQVLDALGRKAEAMAAYEPFAGTNRYASSVYADDVKFWRASHAFNEADWTSARAMFEEFAASCPDSKRAPYALLYASSAAWHATDFEKAIELAEELETLHGDFEHLDAALFTKAEALCHLLRFADAERDLRRIVKNGSAGAELRARAGLRLGDCVFSLSTAAPERIEESAECYRAALRVLGDNAGAALRAECDYKLGRILARTGKAEEAYGMFYRNVILPYETAPSAGMRPWFERAVKDAAAICEAQGRRDEAVRLRALLKTTETNEQ